MLTLESLARAAVVAISAFGVLGAHGKEADAKLVVPRQEYIEDRTLEMWSARWWMWAASFRGNASPIADLEGDRCGAGQEGAAFFLAGTFGSLPVHRTCKVPQGKYLLFPLVTYVTMPDGGVGDCAYLQKEAGMMVADATLFAELDGERIAGLESRRASPANCFNVMARSKGMPKVMAASDGYWLLLRPLSQGRHKLHFGGAVPSLRQDIEYTLLVE